MGHIAAAYPFEKIAIDLMGPLPETPTGNKHLLVVCDYFSKWVELLALPDIRAETVAERLVEDVFSRLGMPVCLHSDQGKQFESSLFQELCRLLGIHKTRTTPYHPQSDGLVERANCTVQNVLAAYVSDHQRDWDCYLAQTQLAYNTSQHSSTGYTPYFLLFGREARLPLSILVDLTVVVDRLSSGRHGSIPGDTAVVQSLMSQEKSLKLESGLLYRKFVPANPGSQVTWQLIVPRQQRPLMFQEAHAGATSGHFAYKRTLEKLRQLTNWPGMSQDVEKWCRSCDMCAKGRSPGSQSQNRAPMGHTAATTPLRAANQVWLNTPAMNKEERQHTRWPLFIEPLLEKRGHRP